MSKNDIFYKNDAGNNFTCEIKNFNSNKLGEITLIHNEEEYTFTTNLKNVYINMMSNVERRNFLNAFKDHLKGKKLNALYQEDKKEFVELSISADNMKPLKKELQEFAKEYIYNLRKEGSSYQVKLKMLTPNDIIVLDNKNNEYSFKYDLLDTYFYEYTEEERRKIIKYAENYISKGETIVITEKGKIGYGAMVDIKFGYSYGNSLNDKIKELINPYQEKTLYGNVFYALVSKVIDGDTIEIFNGNKKERIRLSGIDAPEKKQAFGLHSTAALNNLIKFKKIKIQYTKEEKYGRILGTIFVEQDDKRKTILNVNQKLVEEGFALANNSLYAHSEKLAKESKKGIWLIDFERPEVYRQKNKFFKR